MSNKIDRASHGPSWTEVILGAVLSLALGIVLGAVLLMLRPVVVAKGTPKEIDPKVVYFVEGSRDANKGRQAAAKRKSFVEGNSVTVTEDELNTLVGAAPGATPTAPKAGDPKAAEKGKTADKSAPATPASDGMIATGTPNFRIDNGVFQVGVPVTINALGLDQKMFAQARGNQFVKKGDVIVFEPSELYVGSCPVQRLPFISTYVRNQFLANQPIPEDIKAAWPKLASVTVEGNSLKLAMP